jgi:excisionase family DNA binding protein
VNVGTGRINKKELHRQALMLVGLRKGRPQMQLSKLIPGMVFVGGRKTLTERDIVEFESRLSSPSVRPVTDAVKHQRKEPEATASVWMICAIAQDLASRTEVSELWKGRLPFIERLSWCDSVRPGDELQLQIQVLDKRTSIKGVTSWVRWKWTLTTAGGVEALVLTAGSLLDGSSIESEVAPQPTTRISYKVVEAADIVGVSRYVLYEAIRNRELSAYRPNPRSDLLLLADDLRTWVTRFRADTS